VKVIWRPYQSFKSPIYPLSDSELPIPEELANEFTRSQIRWLLAEKLIFQQFLHPFDNRWGLDHDFFGC